MQVDLDASRQQRIHAEFKHLKGDELLEAEEIG